MKKILGLDLGPNSIAWALIEIDHENGIVRILGLGSRILPMDAGEIKEFEGGGKIKSSAAQRTEKRGARRLKERFLLRRDRLHLVLDLLDALPEHYRLEVDIEQNGKKCGQFKSHHEPKIAYTQNIINSKKCDFLFEESYVKMLQELGVENKEKQRVPKDWTLYYLRQKALKEKISLEELAWVLLSYNQKRGYEKTEVENKSEKENEIVEELDLEVKNVTEYIDKEGRKYFKVELDSIDNFTYNEYSNIQLSFVDDLKEVKVVSKVDEAGNVSGKEYTVTDIYPLKIEDVKYEKDGDKHKYTLTYANGWEQVKEPKKYTFAYNNAKGKEYDYIVTTVYDEKGNIKEQQGKPRKLKEPDFTSDSSNDWTLLKKKTEKEALKFNNQLGFVDNETGNIKKYISPQIYAILKDDAKTGNRTKIIGGMFQVVDREFYRQELNQIIEIQSRSHDNLRDKAIFEKCVKTLYPKNESHAKALLANKNAIQHLLVEDILLYQRPLKSKKSEIANCKYEIRHWKDVFDKNGNIVNEIDIETGELKPKREAIYHKVAPISHPYFQEFRIWDKLHSLKLIQIEKEVNGKMQTNIDVTDEYLKKEDYEKLFEVLNNRKSLNQSKVIDFLKPKFKENKEDSKNFVWNFPEDEELKGNETRVSFVIRFKRCGFTNYSDFLTQEKEYALWHYLYSVSYKERTENDYKSLRTFFSKFLGENTVSEEVKENLIKDFANYPKFASNYCAYSEKTLKKLLPFIKIGNEAKVYKWESEQWYVKWKESLDARKNEILLRLKKIDFDQEIIDYYNVVDTTLKIPFPKGLFNAFRGFDKVEDFASLNLTQSSYLVYGRHSELAQAKYWISPKQIRDELHHELKQHSLNNPVAEKVILEMMQIVADIWDYYGEGKENFFSKIHLEVGRSLKKSAKEKKKIIDEQKGNKVQNKRLRQVLEEFLANNTYNAIPQNTDHFERLKIVEEGAEHTKNINKNFFDENEKLKEANVSKKDIDEILKKPHISKEDFDKYKLWIEQGYRSPYSGKIIKLTDLFNGNKYNIDHIFPQASVTNDSLSNKVVCELPLNKLKSSRTARVFIEQQGGLKHIVKQNGQKDWEISIFPP